MATVTEHYSHHLAPIYVWMAGGLDAALAQGKSDVETFAQAAGPGRLAVDLGAGFGMHAIPLARRGYSVLAIDTSAQLLSTLRECSSGLSIRTVEADLSRFAEHLSDPADLLICMGDTLTHLETHEAVVELFSKAAECVSAAGTFVLTFRDYTDLPAGSKRFIPVRSDGHRILTCFLEGTPTHVVVHDILHEREELDWTLKVSSYTKLRLAPTWVARSLESQGFDVEWSVGPRGMVRIVASRA